MEELRIQTGRLEMFARVAGPRDGTPLVCVHGNVSDSRFWNELLEHLPPGVRAIAPDLRGYGNTEPLGIDATQGLRQLADDVWSLIDALKLSRVVLLGHSMGGGVVQQMTIDHPERVLGLVLEAPAGPFGFGGTKDVDGTPCWEDFAGSGGGLANADFVARLARKDRSEDGDTAPRKVLRRVYFAPSFVLTREREEALLEAMLSTRISEDHAPGDKVPSAHWPGVGPGKRGINNALSPKYLNLSKLAELTSKPPILWIRGANDLIVSDTSLSDIGQLGKLGVVPGWPGDSIFPAQPMVSQLRKVLDRYRSHGGRVEEVVFEPCGHCPHIEHFDRFRSTLTTFLSSMGG